jgi:hypothetical protein
MKMRSALRAVSAATHKFDRAREAERHVSLGDQTELLPYCVTVERRGTSPMKQRLLVRATSPVMAGELACWMAERGWGGMFRRVKVERTTERPADEFDDADFWPTR